MKRDPPGGPFEAGAAGQVAYLTNQYPAPSHTFIRREILALEAAGWRVHRFAHRRHPVAPIDPADVRELRETCVLLDLPLRSHMLAVWTWLAQRPLDTVATIGLALKIAWHGDGRYLAHAAYFAMACVLARRLHELGCCHVHAHFGTNPAAVVRLAHRLCGLRYSLTFHGPHEFDPSLRLNLRAKIEAASFVALVSRAACRRLSQAHPQFAAKFRRVPCGLDAQWLDAPERAGPLGGELVCVARLEPQKDPFLLLDAARVLAERAVDFRVSIVGDGVLREALQRRIAEQGLGRHVVLLGWRTQQQVYEHLSAARALVLSSQDEGLPVVIMEAFALGVPAIAPDVGAVGELVESGKSGWLVPRGDALSLADAMHACLRAEPLALQCMAEEARRRVRSHDIRVAASVLGAQFRDAAERPAQP